MKLIKKRVKWKKQYYLPKKKKMLACLLMDVVRRMDRVSVRKMEKR